MATFDYRKELTGRELLPAIAAGAAAGVAVAYVAQILLRRTPLRPGGGSLGASHDPLPSGSGPQIRVVRR